ncbi:UNVERIFIED_CONTAM: hypothetical protein FKN15_021199 [Acipenser sinensis]
MGVKGLQWFVENVSSEVCVEVNLQEMAKQYQRDQPGCTPTLVVDAMACLKHWYTSEAWVHGGQWREYMHNLETFVRAFTNAGIKLVFFFDGVVEQTKRAEWVKRRLRNNKEISQIFQYIKTTGQQPGREMFFIPSGLATFSRFALKSLGVETWCSVREADYEIASYGLFHNCMGILGQDSDYLIYDTVPYLSISKLQLGRLVTVLFSRENLCQTLKLSKSDLPLLACILGNDVVPENQLQKLRRSCMDSYWQKKKKCSQQTVLAVANYISGHLCLSEGLKEITKLPVSEADRALLEKGIDSYLLPEQQTPWLPYRKKHSSYGAQVELRSGANQDIIQFAKEQHIRADNFMVFNILSAGEVSCSNTLEDDQDPDLPGHALVYRPARQHIYAVLLGAKQGQPLGKQEDNLFNTMLLFLKFAKEQHIRADNFMVFNILSAGEVSCSNTLEDDQDPDLPGHALVYRPARQHIYAVLLGAKQGRRPDLKILWFSEEPEIKNLRYSTFLALFDIQDLSDELCALETHLIGTCCLLIYIALQVNSLCLEDIDAYLAQTLCVRTKSPDQLACTQVACVDSRAVHLGSLFVRGLTILIAANSSCGFPFRMADLMPWEMFDGKLFHSKYLQSHAGCSEGELLEGNVGKHFRYIAAHDIAAVLGSWKAKTFFKHLPGVTVSFFNGKGKKTAWDTWNAFPDVTDAFLTLAVARARGG